MDIALIKEIIRDTIKCDFFKYEQYLLKNNINERSITHQLAMHLRNVPLFDGYHIDCEYNGYTEQPGYKVIHTLESEYKDILEKKLDKLLERKGQRLAEDIHTISGTEGLHEFISKVFPDIIIHKRGINEKNLCIIEVKTSKSGKFKECDDLDKYDFLKLEKYISDLNYTLGVFIKLEVGEGLSRFNLIFFEKDKGHDEMEYNYQ